MDVRGVSVGQACLANVGHARPDRRRQGRVAPHAADAARVAPARSVFADRWLVLEHVGGEMPDQHAAALVSRALRAALMSGYGRCGQGAAIPAIVSGHEADGAPAVRPHLAIAPLILRQARNAHPGVLGLALIPPGAGELLLNADFKGALRAIAPWNAEEHRCELRLVSRTFDLTFALSGLTPSGIGGRGWQNAASYLAVAKTWATGTPVVLDRHLKAKGSAARKAEVEALLRQACRNIGLPEPARVVAGKRLAASAAPSADASPRATNWQLPKSLGSRQLTHATLQFATPVRGPVIIGAGRFAGLGLCRAMDGERCRDG